MIKKYIISQEGEKKLSEHFKVKEFKCKDGSDFVYIDDDLIEILESLRQFIGKPITIISGFRTNAYNHQVGGAQNSYHVQGMAADIKSNMSMVKLAVYAAMMGARGIGIYKDWVHIDTREDRILFREE